MSMLMKMEMSQIVEILATAEDGTTYRIEGRCHPGGKCEGCPYFYYCLPEGELVVARGDGRYELPGGTLVTVVARL